MNPTARFKDALVFAFDLHAGQKRKSTPVPYLSHLMSVSALVMESGGDEDQAIAALLHDSIEDQGPDYPGGSDGLRRELEKRFGPRVLAIVNGCTDSDTKKKPEWRPRKEAYVRHLADAPDDVLRVSVADKLHNARCILADLRTAGRSVWDRFSGRREGSLWYYRAITDLMTKRGAGPLAAELDRTVSELERLG